MDKSTQDQLPTMEAHDLMRYERLKAELRAFIRYARDASKDGSLRCRPLSESITCAETAYLWLCQVPTKDTLLDF